MGLGKLLLISSGEENIITSKDTGITFFFKKVASVDNNIFNETLPQFLNLHRILVEE